MGILWDAREFLGILEDFAELTVWSLLGFWGILPESSEKLEDSPFFFRKLYEGSEVSKPSIRHAIVIGH